MFRDAWQAIARRRGWSWGDAQRVALLLIAVHAVDVLTTIVGLAAGGREVGLDGPQITAQGAMGYGVKMAVITLIALRVLDKVKLGKIPTSGARTFLLIACVLSAAGPIWNSGQLARLLVAHAGV
jgi:hypothetical protein